MLRTALALLALPILCAAAPNFTTGSRAVQYGTHEIALEGNGAAENPFAVAATVQFTPPSGKPVTVDAFYDGGNTWRARLYVTEPGAWHWTSASPDDPKLSNQHGTFAAVAGSLPGLLKPHPRNPKAWSTASGRTFVNVSDTAYRLFHLNDAPLWREFVNDDIVRGITCLRAASLGGWGGTAGARDDNDNWLWNNPWPGGAQPDYSRFDLAKFRNTDQRLTALLDRYPQLQIQFILFGLKGYRSEGTGREWAAIPRGLRERTMRYMLARWAAFPNIFWLIVNDMHHGPEFPLNRAFAREVGRYFLEHDPWHHLIASGAQRGAGDPFAGAADGEWATYVYIEEANAVGADAIQARGLGSMPQHIFMGEDYYEQDQHTYRDPRYFFRWLNWSWLLAGGSANYAGRYGVIHPYSQTARADLHWRIKDREYTGKPLVGLDSVTHIAKYFADRAIDLADFRPNDALATDTRGRTGSLRPKVMERQGAEILVYHPNAAAAGDDAHLDAGAAGVRLDLTGYSGPLQVEWFRANDGTALRGVGTVGGAVRELTSPWPGQDVVLRVRSLR